MQVLDKSTSTYTFYFGCMILFTSKLEFKKICFRILNVIFIVHVNISGSNCTFCVCVDECEKEMKIDIIT